MKRNIKSILLSLLIVSIIGMTSYAAPVASPEKTKIKEEVISSSYETVSPVDVVMNPDKYLNKNITFNAEFIAYTSLGLDYKPAFRDGTKYIGVLIKREDVKNHTIPLSEMKIFITREVAEKHVDLEQGDVVKISGKVFSNALGDPWVDVKTFEIVSQKPKKTE